MYCSSCDAKLDSKDNGRIFEFFGQAQSLNNKFYVSRIRFAICEDCRPSLLNWLEANKVSEDEEQG